uniref:NB-ARC domain-containing protein n=1 Tax=Leersia perrieri TaxID=77586 RepID=A0A0D9XQH1_9ORYZ
MKKSHFPLKLLSPGPQNSRKANGHRKHWTTQYFVATMHDVNQIKIMDGPLPCIEGLYIVSLPKLDKVPQGIESLKSLKKIWVMNLHKDFRTRWNDNGMHPELLLVHHPELL